MTPELVVLSFFDDMVGDKEKEEMAQALLSYQVPPHFAPGKPDFNQVTPRFTHERVSLAILIAPRSWLLLI